MVSNTGRRGTAVDQTQNVTGTIFSKGLGCGWDERHFGGTAVPCGTDLGTRCGALSDPHSRNRTELYKAPKGPSRATREKYVATQVEEQWED